MISFIIIGRNEGAKLLRCLRSVIDAIKQNSISEHEIIYVDSQSTDDSIEKVKEFRNVKIVCINGVCNAAIARNIGYRESMGEYLFFIDGDMELLPGFFPHIFDENLILKYDFVSGDILNHLYDSVGNYVGEQYYFKKKLKSDSFTWHVGGLFCIKRHLWEMIGGMNTQYRRSQDLDLGLRLAKRGVKLMRKKELFVIHHTVDYAEKQRLATIILNGDLSYRGVLYRDHLFNREMLPMLLRWDYTFLLLLTAIIGSLSIESIVPLLVYIAAVIYRAFVRSRFNVNTLLSEFLLILSGDVQVLFGLLFFYPRQKNITYTKIAR